MGGVEFPLESSFGLVLECGGYKQAIITRGGSGWSWKC